MTPVLFYSIIPNFVLLEKAAFTFPDNRADRRCRVLAVCPKKAYRNFCSVSRTRIEAPNAQRQDSWPGGGTDQG